MPKLGIPLLLAALVLVGLGAYDVVRGRGPEVVAAAPPPAARPPATFELTATPTALGTVVTSGGAVLYRFDKDTAKPAKSNCAGQCAVTWPPLLAAGATQLSGVDPALVGIVVRADGSKQVTLGGWPLYRYSGDKVPGETRGEGVSGTWRAVGPTGKPAAATKQPARSSSSKPALPPVSAPKTANREHS
jgi:predicted lipoprotein with Yx(FWY)xxD motif